MTEDASADSVAYYDYNAERFAANTGGLDMSALYERFLRHVPPGSRILDAGCGVGRDALAFVERGYSVVAFDASAKMVRLTRERVAGRVEVFQLRFEEVNWRKEFDGIWACASLLHVPAAEFPAIAAQLAAALRSDGACYMSFKLGAGEHHVGGRLFIDHMEESLSAVLRGTGLILAETWTTKDVRAGRSGERWLNAVTVRTQ